MTTMNLEQHRSDESVWDRNTPAAWDVERSVVLIGAAALLIEGLRRRSLAGLAMTVTGAGLAWWGADGSDARQVHRARMRAVLPFRRHASDDLVQTASEESFPASDSPAFTSNTGNHGPIGDLRPTAEHE